MNSQATIHHKPESSGARMLLVMVGIGLACALFIVVTFEQTKPVIATNRAAALEQAIYKVLPGIQEKHAFTWDAESKTFRAAESGSTDAKEVFAGYDTNGNLVGIAVQAEGIGFADVIRILYGYDPEEQRIVGFHVLESKETPGLGDKIEKDAGFLENFNALDVRLTSDEVALMNPVVPVKHGEKENPWEVDGITGATISSRAIGNMINASASEWLPLIYADLSVFEKGQVDPAQEKNGQKNE